MTRSESAKIAWVKKRARESQLLHLETLLTMFGIERVFVTYCTVRYRAANEEQFYRWHLYLPDDAPMEYYPTYAAISKRVNEMVSEVNRD